jgi:hypothetical protein
VLRRPAPLTAGLFLCAALGGGCSTTPPNVHLDLTVGLETDAFSRDPKVISVLVQGLAPDGSVAVKATATPGGTFDFGEVANTDQLTFEVTGTDAQGQTVMRGRSLGAIPLDSVTGTLPVFVQRVNEWARPPGALAQTHVGGVASTGAERYLVLGGGASDKLDQADLYDMFTLGGVTVGGIARPPETLVPRGTAVLFADAKGATSIDLGTGVATDVTTPTGLASYGLVAGGQAIDSSDGRTFVVGGTRRVGDPTKSVLVAAADGTLTSLDLREARLGATAVWLEGVGLVVAGGSATGAGIEVLAPAATSFATVDFPPDPTVGAGAVVDGPNGVVLIGGTVVGGAVAPIRRIDPTCVNACMATMITGSDPPVGLTSVHAYTLGGERFIVVGDTVEKTPETKTFVLQLGKSATELPLREPRRGAAVVPAPNGTLAILGGTRVTDGTAARSVELLFPQ